MGQLGDTKSETSSAPCWLSKHLGTLYCHAGTSTPRQPRTRIPQPATVVMLRVLLSAPVLYCSLSHSACRLSRQPRQRAEHDMQPLHQQRKAALLRDPSCTVRRDT